MNDITEPQTPDELSRSNVTKMELNRETNTFYPRAVTELEITEITNALKEHYTTNKNQ